MPVIMLTNQVEEAKLMVVVAQIEALSDIVGSITRIRVESLDG